MQIAESQSRAQARTPTHTKRLLFVGPKPPPIGGSPLTVQAMLEELESYPSVEIRLISTSPALDVRKKMTGFNFEKVKRSVMILPRFIHELPRCDAALVFANDLFAITLAPILLLFAKLFRKPFYLKPVGAGLDLFINAQKKIFREYLLFVLRSVDGILTQTQMLKNDLQKMGLVNAHYLPGCRPLASISQTAIERGDEFRLIYLGHITRLKGILYLIESLGILSKTCPKKVTCDFFGPIHDELREEFNAGLKSQPNARYCGVAEAGTGPQLIAHYDALVLPTYYDTEGQPGVLIEAMHAGVPVIATQVRTFPELIEHGVNGLLVPLQDPISLANAIETLAENSDLYKQMAEANRQKGHEFRADAVVERMLQIIFPDVKLEKRP
ncbi:MAG: glycosyltransferase family 4 protein [Chloroflexota bacterium]